MKLKAHSAPVKQSQRERKYIRPQKSSLKMYKTTKSSLQAATFIQENKNVFCGLSLSLHRISSIRKTKNDGSRMAY